MSRTVAEIHADKASPDRHCRIGNFAGSFSSLFRFTRSRIQAYYVYYWLPAGYIFLRRRNFDLQDKHMEGLIPQSTYHGSSVGPDPDLVYSWRRKFQNNS